MMVRVRIHEDRKYVNTWCLEGVRVARDKSRETVFHGVLFIISGHGDWTISSISLAITGLETFYGSSIYLLPI